MSTKPIRGQRRRGAPSLVLPGDPDGCGWIASGDGLYWPVGNDPIFGHSKPVAVRYVGRPTRWGNPYRVVKGRSGLARHLAPLVTADVLSCWCPLDAPCHADTLCDLVGRLRTGDLVPGLVATPDVCGGALRIDGTEWAVAEIASNVSSWLDAGMCRNDMVLQTAATYSLDPDLVRLAARVGGAL